ncbi:MAG TPA: hypothetical protein VF588_06710 [Pyrinomonadaceae bacterium]|jgi:hypothetical protein
MKRALGVALFAALLLSLNAREARACSCADFSVRQKFRGADAVFLGRVVELTPFGPTEDFPAAMYLVRFEVERRWKGDAGREVTAVADVDIPNMCGDLKLAVGESYLIYAPREKGRLHVYGDCGPNRDAKDAGDEMKRLGGFWFRVRARLYPYPEF